MNWAVVDDDLIFHLLTKRILERKDTEEEAHFFRNGKEAFEFLLEHKDAKEKLPDVILLDLNMPVMNGWEFLSNYLSIKNELSKNISIYIVTSSLDKVDVKRAKEISDIKEYVVKPINEFKIQKITEDLKAA